MPSQNKPFDAADSLTSPELIDGYLDEAIATGNPANAQRPGDSEIKLGNRIANIKGSHEPVLALFQN